MPLDPQEQQDYNNYVGQTPDNPLLPPGATPIDAAIIKYESGGRNILQQQVSPSISTASGIEQITDSTWHDFAPKAGVDLSQYPTAMSAPLGTQIQVGHAIQAERGLSPWTNYNPELRNYLAGKGYGTGLMGPTPGGGQNGPVERPDLQPIAGESSGGAQQPSIVLNMQSPGAAEPHQNPLALWSIIQAMTSGSHKFIPVDYDPWKIKGQTS